MKHTVYRAHVDFKSIIQEQVVHQLFFQMACKTQPQFHLLSEAGYLKMPVRAQFLAAVGGAHNECSTDSCAANHFALPLPSSSHSTIAQSEVCIEHHPALVSEASPYSTCSMDSFGYYTVCEGSFQSFCQVISPLVSRCKHQ